jgi:c(7)-type cytochrome triheme protein
MNRKIIFISTISLLIYFYFTVFAGKEKSELIFSHKQHVVENELECATCHESAENSKSGKDNLMPSMEICGACHDVESSEACGICHSDTENPRNVPRVEDYFPLFSHEMHLTAGLECDACHQEVTLKEVVEPYILPKQKDCQLCHTQKKVKPQTHGPNYIHVHADDSKSNTNIIQTSQSCNLCHSSRYCQYCHEGDNLDRITHPLNYAFTHSMDVRGKERECSVCHTERSFCDECHRANFILPHNHTAGWAIPFVGGQHVSEAQNDLDNCLSCHEQNAEQNCQKSGCHSK